MTRPRIPAILAAASVLALGACSSKAPETDKQQVATLESVAPTTPAAAGRSTGQPEGVQLRLDTTDEETARLWDVYNDCLVANGVKVVTGNSGAGPVAAAATGTRRRVLDDSGEPKAAYTTCKPKIPLQPVELDPDRNPNFAAQWQENVRCLRKHGVMVHVTEPGSWTWDSSDTVVPDNEQQLEKQCIQETFGANKK